MKLSVETATQKLRNLLAGCGISRIYHGPTYPNSMYLEISPDGEHDDDGDMIKIRVSDHELPHHHHGSTPSDIELGPNNIYAFGSLDRYPGLPPNICDRYSLPYSPLRRILTRRKNVAQLAAQKRAEMETIRAEEASARIAAARHIYKLR